MFVFYIKIKFQICYRYNVTMCESLASIQSFPGKKEFCFGIKFESNNKSLHS